MRFAAIDTLEAAAEGTPATLDLLHQSKRRAALASSRVPANRAIQTHFSQGEVEAGGRLHRQERGLT